MSDELRVVEADDELCRAIFRNVHESWGGELPVEEFVARRMRSPHHSRARWFAGLVGGKPVSSLGWFPLSFQLTDRVVGGLGIGAVHTVPEWRGRGLASKLLAEVLERARAEGLLLALLFTEIGTSFYERFGFRRCAAYVHTAVLTRRVQPPAAYTLEPIHPQRHLAWIKRTHAIFHSQLDLHIHRDDDYWNYWMRRWPVPKWFLFRDRSTGRKVGYVRARATDRTLLVEEYGIDSDSVEEERALLNHLAALGRSVRCEAISGWLMPRRALEHLLSASPRTRSVPMLAALRAEVELEPLCRNCHFWMAEYF